MPLEELPPIAEIQPGEDVDLAAIAKRGKPVVVRGAVTDWPMVEAARRGTQDLMSLIVSLDNGSPVDLMIGQPTIEGRFFYRDDMAGFNFDRQKGRLRDVVSELAKFEGSERPPSIYAGAASTKAHAPQFDASHALPGALAGAAGQSRLWLGNRIEVATHFDMSPNLAAVVAGTRRFTLFDPRATPSLYVGPLDRTIAGQPVSMVNPLDPDLERYPAFADAWQYASSALLEPGDAIYMPALWWHHVQALADVNVLVNYWYEDAQHGGPFLAFIHALWAIRDLPEPHREGWRTWFDHFVFGEGARDGASHLPEAAKLINGPPSPERDKAIHGFLLQVLSGR